MLKLTRSPDRRGEGLPVKLAKQSKQISDRSGLPEKFDPRKGPDPVQRTPDLGAAVLEPDMPHLETP
jgi:hypothetical protein